MIIESFQFDRWFCVNSPDDNSNVMLFVMIFRNYFELIGLIIREQCGNVRGRGVGVE